VGRNRAAAAAFEAELDELDVELSTEAARRSARLAAADEIWRRELGRLLTRREAQELMGVGTRQGMADHVKHGRLLALPGEGGRYSFPAFQFGADGRPHPGFRELLDVLHDAFESPYTLAAWFTTPQAELGGETPAESLRTGEKREALLLAAERARARLLH
jgi:Protein of unknown function (DUF2384)